MSKLLYNCEDGGNCYACWTIRLGKSTFAEILAGIQEPEGGEVLFEGRAIGKFSETAKFDGIQIVFQDPFTSINEHLKIVDAVLEPLEIIQYATKQKRLEEVKRVLQLVNVATDGEFLNRRVYTLSGGQRQRIAIARALIMQPKLLIADEISSMLDPSNGANLLRLLKGIQNEKGFAMLFITHDLPLARKISDKIYIMKQGEIVETGPAYTVFQEPKHEYTKQLLANGI